MRRTIDVLGWAADLPPEKHDDGREMLRRTHDQAVSVLRRDRPGGFVSALELKVAPLPAAVIVAVFLLGLGIGLSFGGTT